MVRIEKNGLIREVESLDAAQEYIRQGYAPSSPAPPQKAGKKSKDSAGAEE